MSVVLVCTTGNKFLSKNVLEDEPINYTGAPGLEIALPNSDRA